MQQLRNKIQSEVQDSVQQSQRDYYLREQMKAIQKELGDLDDTQKDIADLKTKIETAGMPEEVQKDALKELGRLSRMNPAAADYSLTRELCRVAGRAAVGEDELRRGGHSEGAAVPRRGSLRAEEGQGPDPGLSERSPSEAGHEGTRILCFVGPPGVGKTSLGRSIARALDRKFSRISLGGMHDEAEIRGHRRTYIGALPGQIIQHLKRVEVKGPSVHAG